MSLPCPTKTLAMASKLSRHPNCQRRQDPANCNTGRRRCLHLPHHHRRTMGQCRCSPRRHHRRRFHHRQCQCRHNRYGCPCHQCQYQRRQCLCHHHQCRRQQVRRQLRDHNSHPGTRECGTGMRRCLGRFLGAKLAVTKLLWLWQSLQVAYSALGQ